MFDAILFDNEGLVDTEDLYFRANQETLAGVGIDLDAATYVELFARGAGRLALGARRGLAPADVEALRPPRWRTSSWSTSPTP